MRTAGREVIAVTAAGVPGAGPAACRGCPEVQDRLAPVLEHSDADEPSCTCTGMACSG